MQLQDRAVSLGDVLRTQARVFHALMLRDVRTRFFGNGLGFLLLALAGRWCICSFSS